MGCLHPQCPRGSGSHDWESALDQLGISIAPGIRSVLLARLADLGHPGEGVIQIVDLPPNLQDALLERAPCLYTQTGIPCAASAVVHLAECTIGDDISAENAVRAFEIQHPNRGENFTVPPLVPCTNAGDVSEHLCSRVLTNAGLPAMPLGADKWPIWTMPGHILLNQGKMSATRAFGDLLIPAAPTNVIISVKTETAKERLLYSANAIEAVGFGFFKTANEFWTTSRMKLYKRMGFTAIYMPPETLEKVQAKLATSHSESHAVNVNGTALYRSITDFGTDMARIVGRTTLDL